MTASLVLATAQYRIDFLETWQNYESKITALVDDAVAQGANFLLFPEYFSMELASIFEEKIYRSLDAQLEALQSVLEPFRALYQRLAQQHQIYIQAGTFPVHQPVDANVAQYVNRAYLFRPDGSIDFQDKLQMTRFENEQWQIRGGDELRTLDTEFGKIGICVCYDSEFPLLARQQVEQGAVLILVPSCTDTQAGYYRVRIGAQARALENQCYVAQSPTIGEAPWSEAVDINSGRAECYTPVDYGFPDNGVLAESDHDNQGWVIAELDPQGLSHVRDTGQVFNHRDWPAQQRWVAKV